MPPIDEARLSFDPHTPVLPNAMYGLVMPALAADLSGRKDRLRQRIPLVRKQPIFRRSHDCGEAERN